MAHSIAQPLLKIENLSVLFGRPSVPVVNDVNFSMLAGQCLGLVGESGSGKSMTSLAITQLLPTTAWVGRNSQILFKGRDLLRFSERAMRSVRGSQIGFIFQDAMSALNPVLTIGQQLIEVASSEHHVTRRTKRLQICQLLEAVGLPQPEHYLSVYPHELSGGMRQRSMIAMALVGKPKLVIADEPTSALDVTLQAQLFTLLKQLQQQMGVTLLFISHNLSIVAQLADEIVVLKKGEVVERASAKQFFTAPQHPYSQKLLAAILPCEPRQTSLSTSASPASTRILSVEQLKVYFPIRRGLLRRTVGYVQAVDSINFSISAQETLALIGESGCGKTTTGKTLLQLIPKTSGEIIFDGTPMQALSRRALHRLRAKLQMIFQDPYAALDPRMTIADSLMEGLFALGKIKSRQKALIEVDRWLTLVELPHHVKYRYPHEFSGGERQRLCIARALTLEPRLLVLDEPTSALDVSVQIQILELLEQLQAQLGLSYLLITHDMSVVAFLAHRVAVMQQGHIVEQGMTSAILQHPQHDYTRRLLAAVPVVNPYQ